MAAVILQIRGCSRQLPIITTIYFPHQFKRNYSSEQNLASFKRGTGGRSSFSGVVATVFGANGILGRRVVNQLGKLGTQIIIPYRGDNYDVGNLKLCGDLGQILFHPFSLKDEESLYKAMKYSNLVINLIGKETETRNFSFEDVHVTGARNIARIAKELGVKKLIHVSALNACEKPKPIIIKSGSRFLASKWRGEQAVREEFPEAIIFRPSDMFGQPDRFLFYYAKTWRRQIRSLPLWKKGNETIKQPVFVSDVAKGIVNSVFDDDAIGKTFEAVGPRRYFLGELLDWVYLVLKKGPDWGYKRTDMRFSPLFWLKVSFVERIMTVYPFISWEKVERDHVTDTLTPGLPNLEDLGVKLTYIEDRVAYDLKMFRDLAYYDWEVHDFTKPPPPPVANA
ncbi:NADH dehydrogenase [ubiquinone] 1 alpha subcomplex subunit 9, mitochondrial-like isoform X1 [Centruroides sculpturatus]|uniref:NADH dehydrogenase [ubiquinone] 1 alpha subcomplex subunit 9, mitochondrial-like isoform X1 n=1 Tax=Centruroides sculpturatus TaxID=218467 RepID=UPI000C6D8BED|nr:NADH dehydrogenase [ubiquinone] 1 alpha subcomplex subunit 9, mitochondrial-like isoform X1 [Centruroides sculpturatus]